MGGGALQVLKEERHFLGDFKDLREERNFKGHSKALGRLFKVYEEAGVVGAL